ncbi:DUF1801 domain-containing protein [Ferruginibacter yonginensis]|uniref:DUF1801 domain-containing protein n=1 Tax=Ferruginibacter yonginensis TaxID=1310416 RepID=A0ABV8QRD1_9BACT
MNSAIKLYNNNQIAPFQQICNILANTIDDKLDDAESKIWHAHPVWFLQGNPIVGYSKLKNGIKLMFWSGADFNEALLQPGSGKFKDAAIYYNSIEEIDIALLQQWLTTSKTIQWDYKNIVKNKGKLFKI